MAKHVQLFYHYFTSLVKFTCILSFYRNIAENVLKQFAGQLPNVHNVHPHMMGQAGAIQVPS